MSKLIEFCARCCRQLNDNEYIVRKGRRVCRVCANAIDELGKIEESTQKNDYEEVISYLRILKESAIDDGKNTIVKDVCLDSLKFAVDQAIEFIQYMCD